MVSASFNWTTLEAIRPALLQNSVGTVGKTTATNHLHELERVGAELHASELAHQNAAKLATGYDDLVVVLREPSDKAERVEYDEMKASSKALQLVDEALNLAFAGQRCVDNTIILDRWPFRSAEIRKEEEEEEEEEVIDNNEKAGIGFEYTLGKLRPKVILICQCRPAAPGGSLSNQWSSSIEKAGGHGIIELGDGHSCLCVYSFHPMFFEKMVRANESMKRVLSEYLFDATFVKAANLLTGRKLTGYGLRNLRDCARREPVPVYQENGFYWTYEWTSQKDCCSDELWALVKDDFRRKQEPFEKLLATYRVDYLRDQKVRGTTRIALKYGLKNDVLSIYRSSIQDPPRT